MSAERLVVVFAQTTDAAEDLLTALDMAKTPPWKPLPPGANPATVEQERHTQEETDAAILVFLKRAAAAGYQTPGSLVIP